MRVCPSFRPSDGPSDDMLVGNLCLGSGPVGDDDLWYHHREIFIFRCVLASLYIRGSVRRSVTLSLKSREINIFEQKSSRGGVKGGAPVVSWEGPDAS